MKEFMDKLNRKVKEKTRKYAYTHIFNNLMSDGFSKGVTMTLEIANELAEEYKGRNIIDGDYCWQNCSATEHCKECNRLCNGSIDYYENYDFMAEEPQWKQAMMNTFLARK